MKKQPYYDVNGKEIKEGTLLKNPEDNSIEEVWSADCGELGFSHFGEDYLGPGEVRRKLVPLKYYDIEKWEIFEPKGNH